MPLQYESIIKEHMAVREKAGIFDVSHMGEVIVENDGSLEFLESITCNSIASLYPGRVQYNALINPNGGIVDDILIYQINENKYFIVVNASNTEKAFTFMQNHKPEGVLLENKSTEYHQIAIQGPLAADIVEKHFNQSFSDIKYYHFKDIDFNGVFYRISRTGYTGEDGFEVYCDNNSGVLLWDALLKSGADRGLLPVGLGARDTLRLESRYPLYGHELNDDWTPVESSINFIVKEKSIHYGGYDRIMDHKKNGVESQVTGFILEDRGVPRDGYDVEDENGNKIGSVLSGCHSPVLETGIGTTKIPVEYIRNQSPVYIVIRGKKLKAKPHKGPFVKGSAGKV